MLSFAIVIVMLVTFCGCIFCGYCITMFMLQLRSLSWENHYSFFIFVFATGHSIQPTDLFFGMKAHFTLDRAKKKYFVGNFHFLMILGPFSPIFLA